MFAASSKQGCQSGAVNVGEDERKISIAAGAALLVCGITGMSMARLVLLAAGGAMVYRGLTGHCKVYEAMEQPGSSDGGRAVTGADNDAEMDMQQLAASSAKTENSNRSPKTEQTAQAKSK